VTAGPDIQHEEVLVEVARARQELALRPEGNRMAVEDQLVVAAHLVHVQERPLVLDGLLSNHVASQCGLAHRERARRQIHEHIDARARELRHGVASVEAAGPELGVVPDFLAHRYAKAHAPEQHRLNRSTRLEVPVFIEDVVSRQQRLVVMRGNAPVVAEHGRVEKRLAFAADVGLSGADQDSESLVGQIGDAIPQRLIRLDESCVREQVPRWITGRGEFGQHQQIGARPARAGRRVGDARVVGVKGTNREVHLCEGKSHGTQSIVPRARAHAVRPSTSPGARSPYPKT
jgi:hypothetical protein